MIYIFNLCAQIRHRGRGQTREKVAQRPRGFVGWVQLFLTGRESFIYIYIYVFFFSSLFLDWNSLLFLGGGVLFLVVVLWAHVWESVSTERVTKIRLLLLQSFKCNRRINTGDTR